MFLCGLAFLNNDVSGLRSFLFGIAGVEMQQLLVILRDSSDPCLYGHQPFLREVTSQYCDLLESGVSFIS